jgi:hypothetical protein
MALDLSTEEKSVGFCAMRRSGGISGKRGASPDREKGVRSNVSLKRYSASKLDQRVRWMRKKKDAKEAS